MTLAVFLTDLAEHDHGALLRDVEARWRSLSPRLLDAAVMRYRASLQQLADESGASVAERYWLDRDLGKSRTPRDALERLGYATVLLCRLDPARVPAIRRALTDCLD